MIVIRASSLKTYFECPRRWLLDTLQPVSKRNESLILGQEVHAMIERYLFSHYEMSTTRDFRKIVKELATVFRSNMHRELAKAAISSKTDYYAFAEKVLKAFIKSFDDSHISSKIFDFSSEKKLSIHLGEHVLLAGSYDVLLTDKGSGTATLWDLKTMQSRQALATYLMQLSAYALLVEKELKLKIVELGVIKVVKTQRPYVEFESVLDDNFLRFCIYSAEVLAKYLATSLEEYLGTKNDFLFPPAPNHWSCNIGYCAHYAECQARKER